MPEPHVIRLRGPWEYEPLERFVRLVDGPYCSETEGLPPAGKVQLPCDWSATLGHDFRGRVRFTRHFNCPTNLDAEERVWLAFDGVDYQAQVLLNDHKLGWVQGYERPRRVEITTKLQPHNLLLVEVSLPASVFRDPDARPGRAGAAGGLIGEVRLEIGRV